MTENTTPSKAEIAHYKWLLSKKRQGTAAIADLRALESLAPKLRPHLERERKRAARPTVSSINAQIKRIDSELALISRQRSQLSRLELGQMSYENRDETRTNLNARRKTLNLRKNSLQKQRKSLVNEQENREKSRRKRQFNSSLGVRRVISGGLPSSRR